MKKIKPEVWGEDKDGNFTINGKPATKKQRQQVCDDLKFKCLDLLPELEKRVRNLTPRHPLRLQGNLPENYHKLLPRIEAQAQNLPSHRVPNNPFELFRELAQRLTKGPIKAPPDKEPDSNDDLFYRLAVLQAKREGITPEQLVYELLERKKSSESTDGGNKITGSEGAREVAKMIEESQSTGGENAIAADEEDTQKDISSKNNYFRWDIEAEHCAVAFKKERDQGSQTSRLDFCKRYAEEHSTKVSGSTLNKKLGQFPEKWNPNGKYGRPKSTKR